jgi:hypothetical protein
MYSRNGYGGMVGDIIKYIKKYVDGKLDERTVGPLCVCRSVHNDATFLSCFFSPLFNSFLFFLELENHGLISIFHTMVRYTIQ